MTKKVTGHWTLDFGLFRWFGEAEPVSGIIFEDGFNAVGSFGGFGDKVHTLALQVVISFATVVGVENTRSHYAFRHDRAQLV